MRHTRWIVASLSPRLSTRRPGVFPGAPVQASKGIAASRHHLARAKSFRPAQPSLSCPSSTRAHNDDDKTAPNPAAAEGLPRATPGSLQGIGEALTQDDLKPSAPWGLAMYRTTYGDDAAWGRMRDALCAAVASALELYGCADALLPRLSHAFIEDRANEV